MDVIGKSLLPLALAAALPLAARAQEEPDPALAPSRRYAVVVRAATREAPGWEAVVDALRARHDAEVFTFTDALDEVRAAVGAYRPRYVCFVCPPSVDFPRFVRQANVLCRRLDDDPYVDAIWGVLTGLDAAHARALAAAEPIRIRRAFAKTGLGWLDWLPEGLFLTEDQRRRGVRGVKRAGQATVVTQDGPPDDEADAREVAACLGREPFDLLIGSGHGGHDAWMLMYPQGRPHLVARAGRLFVLGAGPPLEVRSERPKVYWAVGNCLTGVVNAPGHPAEHSYALAWMRNGVKQYVGAVAGTWYGTNWYLSDYFLNQQGRWSFAESLFLLRQWARHELAAGLVEGRDRAGTEFTDEIFVLYGDPAIEARVVPERAPSLDEALTLEVAGPGGQVRGEYRVRVHDTAARCCGGGKYGGWRVYATLLPFQVADAAVTDTDLDRVVFAGETLLWDSGEPLQAGAERRVRFRARRVDR